MLGQPIILKHRRRHVTAQEVAFIRELIVRNPSASRRQLSALLCQAWNWRQSNGALSDLLARGLMLALERAGHLRLPPPRQIALNNIIRRKPPEPWLLDTSAIEAKLSELQPLEFLLVRRTPQEVLFDSLIHQYHYLGYTRPVGEHLKYLVVASGGRPDGSPDGDPRACPSRDATTALASARAPVAEAWSGRPVAALAFSSAPRHLGPRDRFIGWSAEARRRNIRGVAYNPRFLILPWVRVPHLASHVLSRITRRLSEDWQRLYGHPVHFAETFVDPSRFKGTCYRAANWVPLGQTQGRGKDDQTHKPNRSIKDVLGYPLCQNFRELLRSPDGRQPGAAPGQSLLATVRACPCTQRVAGAL